MIVLAGMLAWIGITDMGADFAYVGEKVLAEEGSGNLEQRYLLERDFPMLVCHCRYCVILQQWEKEGSGNRFLQNSHCREYAIPD